MSNLEGLDKLNRRLDAISDGRSMLRRVQITAVAEAKVIVPRKTGTLARSIAPGPVNDNYAVVKATANYAAAVELGTKPHIIRPKSKRALAWSTGARRLSGRATVGARRAGQMAFATLVHHPGTKAQAFLVPGAKRALDRVGVRAIIEKWNAAA